MGVAKAIFIPHHSNNHWPLALRHRSLAYTSLFLVVTKIVAISALALAPASAQLSTITESRMVQLTNEARMKAGLPVLATSSKLAQAAKLKGEDMLKHQYFAHISPSGVTPWFWMQKTGYDYEVAGENLAIDFLDAEAVISAWLASPSHKANLLHKEYTQTGIAVVSGQFQGGTSIIVIHMFGKPFTEEESTPAVAGVMQQPVNPSPTPIVQPQYTAPRAPRISLLHTPAHAEDVVSFRAEGEKNSSLILLIEGKQRSITIFPESGQQDIFISAKYLRSGKLVAQAFTRTSAGVESKLSEPVSFVNPASVAGSSATSYEFALSPAFDQQQIALMGKTPSIAWQLFGIESPIAINAHIVRALPSFAIHEQSAANSFVSSIIHATRKATSLILLIVSTLLVLAIVVSIKVQHPALIMHASLVIFLATVLLIA